MADWVAVWVFSCARPMLAEEAIDIASPRRATCALLARLDKSIAVRSDQSGGRRRHLPTVSTESAAKDPHSPSESTVLGRRGVVCVTFEVIDVSTGQHVFGRLDHTEESWSAIRGALDIATRAAIAASTVSQLEADRKGRIDRQPSPYRRARPRSEENNSEIQ